MCIKERVPEKRLYCAAEAVSNEQRYGEDLEREPSGRKLRNREHSALSLCFKLWYTNTCLN